MSTVALVKGLCLRSYGLVVRRRADHAAKYAPDLLEGQGHQPGDRAFPLLVAVSLLLPPLVGGLWSWPGRVR